MSRPRKQIRFKIGEAFPADDSCARLMVALAMATNDLLTVGPLFEEALKAEGEADKGRQIYFFRLMASHLREAVKVLDRAEKNPSFRILIEGLPEGVRKDLQELSKYYRPFNGSFAEKVLKPLRDTVFHYSRDEDVGAGLRAIKNEKTEIIIGPQLRDMRLLIADDVVASHWLREIEAGGHTLAEAIAHSRKMLELFGRVMNHLVGLYLERSVIQKAEVTDLND